MFPKKKLKRITLYFLSNDTNIIVIQDKHIITNNNIETDLYGIDKVPLLINI